jgi:two-component system chemotaxis response regulator CheY
MESKPQIGGLKSLPGSGSLSYLAMKRILLIEDDEALRSILRMSLEKMGHAVTEAGNGREAIRIFKKTSPDLVLTDLIMPEIEGLEAIRAMRRAQPELKIIAMSGGGRSDARDNLKMAKNFGATAVFAKPFSIKELHKVITSLLADTEPDNSDPVFLKE